MQRCSRFLRRNSTLYDEFNGGRRKRVLVKIIRE
jgi:hypothetical protein